MNDIDKRAHVLKHSHIICMGGDFDKILHEVSICNGPRAVLFFILHKSIFLHCVHHGTGFYDKYINTDDREKYINDDGSGIFPKQKVGNIYNAKYLDTYGNRSYIASTPYIKYTRILRVYSGRKQKATGFAYFKRFIIS